jgi:hypothetical protein
MKKILKKKKLIKSSHDSGFGIFGRLVLVEQSRQPIKVGPGSSAKSPEIRVTQV